MTVNTKRAFTLIELLVVIAKILLASGLATASHAAQVAVQNRQETNLEIPK